jgi:large subunit ribosomal protein L3
MKFILGKKIGMTQTFSKEGRFIPVTLIEAGPCQVVQVKTKDKDGYQAVQVGFEKIDEKKVKKSQKNKPFRFLKEFSGNNLKDGDQIDVSVFNPGEIVKVIGFSKGKGFQGVVKRHGFAGFSATHGTKHGERAPGSIGSAFPERVFKGKKMAGRTGNQRIVAQGLEVVEIDQKNNLLAVKGAVPGRKGTFLEISVTKEIAAVEEEKKEKLVAQLEQEEKEAQKPGKKPKEEKPEEKPKEEVKE